MLSVVYLASALILGIAVTKRLGLRLLPFETPALSVALGLVLWTWLSFLVSLFLPTALSLPLSVGAAAVASFWLWRGSPAWRYRELGASSSWTSWTVFTLISTIVISSLMWTHDLIATPAGVYSAGATWADFGLHASLISHFAATSQLSLDFPVAAGAHLTYPLLTDLLSGWLVAGGWSLHAAIFVPSLLLATAALQLLLGFGVRLLGTLSSGLIAVTLTLLCGSAAGIFVAAHDFSTSGLSIWQFLAHLPRDYSITTEPNAQIANFLADALLPQRAFLFGLPIFAAVMTLLTILRHQTNLRLSLITGALIGLLPLAHVHTFLVLGAVVAGFWIETVIRTHRPANQWLAAGLTALIVAAPQLAWQMLGNHSGSGGHLALGWTIQPGESFGLFWAHNYGLTGLLILGTTLVLALHRPARRFLPWYLPFLAIFLIANLYSFQAFAYDNLKLIYSTYFMTYLFAGYGAVWLIRRQRWLVAPALTLALVIAASGALSVLREFELQDQFASPDDVRLAAWIRTSTRPTDVFAATDRPNQPISALAGRPVISGYRGWLYSYHLDYQPRLDAIQAALIGQPTAATSTYQARYLAVATYETPDWIISPDLSAHYQTVYSNPGWTIYRLPDE